MSPDSKNLSNERVELQKDLLAFRQAFNTIRSRLFEVSEEHPERGLDLWPGSWACLGSLELACSSIEKKILELDALIQNQDPAEEKDPNAVCEYCGCTEEQHDKNSRGFSWVLRNKCPRAENYR